MNRLTTLLLSAALSASAQYSARQTGAVVQLEDARNQMVVTVTPAIGALAIEIKVRGTNILRTNWNSVDEFLAKPTSTGVSYRGPWFNRLDEHAFWANGRKYVFNDGLGNIRGQQAMSGFLMVDPANQWRLVEFKSDAKAAWVTSNLDFYRHPDWMAQWPFAHTVEVTYRLENGVLEVRTRVENLSLEPMPVSFGFEPGFRLTDAPRDEWTLGIGARGTWLLTPEKMPTGEVRKVEEVYGTRQNLSLKGLSLDNQFADFERDAQGRCLFWMQGKNRESSCCSDHTGRRWESMRRRHPPRLPASSTSSRRHPSPTA